MRRPVIFGIDIVAVFLFAAIGRASHHEAVFSGLWTTAWPFLIGLPLGWAWFLVSRWFKDPMGLITGAGIALVTGLSGLMVRSVIGQGDKMPFPIIACTMLMIIFAGWRFLAGLRIRRSTDVTG